MNASQYQDMRHGIADQIVTKAQNLTTDMQVSATVARQALSTGYCCDRQIMDDMMAGARGLRVQEKKFIQDFVC